MAVGLLAALCTFSVRAADPTDKKAAADKPENSAEEAHDRYQVPEGDVKELLAYFKDLRAFRPKTKDELTKHRAKGMAAMKEAAEKIQLLAKDQDKTLEGYEEAIGFLLMARAAEARNAMRLTVPRECPGGEREGAQCSRRPKRR